MTRRSRALDHVWPLFLYGIRAWACAARLLRPQPRDSAYSEPDLFA